MLAPASALRAAPQAASPGELAREILAESGYQTELPGEGDDGGLDLSWLDRDLVEALGWALLALCLVVAAVLLARHLADRRTRDVEVRSPGGAAPRANVALGARPLEEAERLAREGRYGEAARVLLQLTFEALREAGALRLEPWRTARALARGAELSDAAREALAELVRAVELAVFAGREPSADEYERCASRFRDLRALARGGGA